MFKLVEDTRTIFGNRYKKLSLQFKNWMEFLGVTLSLKQSSRNTLKIWVFLSSMINYLSRYFWTFGDWIHHQAFLKSMQARVSCSTTLKMATWWTTTETTSKAEASRKMLHSEPSMRQQATQLSIIDFDRWYFRLYLCWKDILLIIFPLLSKNIPLRFLGVKGVSIAAFYYVLAGFWIDCIIFINFWERFELNSLYLFGE
jgi:hypothetical protein